MDKPKKRCYNIFRNLKEGLTFVLRFATILSKQESKLSYALFALFLKDRP